MGPGIETRSTLLANPSPFFPSPITSQHEGRSSLRKFASFTLRLFVSPEVVHIDIYTGVITETLHICINSLDLC